MMETLRQQAFPRTVLLIEDDASHARLIVRCLEDHPVRTEIIHIADGEGALDYLYKSGSFWDARREHRPHLILLDLRLPRLDGLEVLRQIKSSRTLQSIPVVILTTSNAVSDVASAYALHANSYLVKPFGIDEFSRLIRTMGTYWLECNESSSPT